MKVALDFASNWEIRGGVWRYGLELTRALVRIRPANTVLVPCYDQLPDSRLQELRSTGATIIGGPSIYYDVLESTSRRRGRIIPWNKLLPVIYPPTARQVLFRRALGDADLYHGVFTCRGTPKRGATVGTIHDLIPLVCPGSSDLAVETLTTIVNAHRAFAELVIVPSEATKRDLVQHLGFPSDRIRVVYHGINTEAFHPQANIDASLLAEHGLVPGRYFLYVGALERRKNIDRLVAAYRSTQRAGLDFPLVLSGTQIHKLPVLEQALADPASGVKHIGYVSEAQLPGLYRAACALVHVAEVEGFGFTPLEAMSCGTPAVVTRDTATGETVNDAGLRVNPGDVGEIANALEMLRSDMDLRTRLGRLGHERAATFTWDKCAADTYAVYQEAYALSQRKTMGNASARRPTAERAG